MFCTSASSGVADLVRAAAPVSCKIRLDELIAAARADRVAARLEAAERRDRQLAVERDARPSAARRSARAGRAKPADSSVSTDMIVYASCSSNRSMSARVTRACSSARLVDASTAVELERIGAARERERRGRRRRAGDPHARGACASVAADVGRREHERGRAVADRRDVEQANRDPRRRATRGRRRGRAPCAAARSDS